MGLENLSETENRQVINSQQGFKLKKNRNGHILRYKARCVAHGFKQKRGINFIETLAACVKSMSYKCLFRVSVKCRYTIRQMDVVTAFLYGFLSEILYFEQANLFELKPKLVCSLRKALSRLK